VSEIWEARDFAIRAHGDQKYGGEPYGVHLFDVAGIVHEFGYSNDHRKAAFLHDVLEDTATTSDQILDLFGENVLRLVFACTGEGESRAERNNSIYRKIVEYPPAAPVKLADRIANVEAATPGCHHWRRYKAEMPQFRAVIRPHVPDQMWDRLEGSFRP
jgi:(p)ppGpp synthase/HD superfamily hydrolase